MRLWGWDEWFLEYIHLTSIKINGKDSQKGIENKPEASFIKPWFVLRWTLCGCYGSSVSKKWYIRVMIIIQAMPGWSHILHHEKHTIQGAPLSYTRSWTAQRSCVMIICLLLPPAQQAGPIKWSRWDTDYSHMSEHSRKGVLETDSQMKFQSTTWSLMLLYGASGIPQNFLRLRLIMQVTPNAPSPVTTWTETKFL